MIKNGLWGEAQADETMKMWLCSFHEYDFGLGRGRFVFLSKVRKQKRTRFESCMKQSEPAQAPGTTGRTVLASDVSRNPISYSKVWMCPLCWMSLQFHRVLKGDKHSAQLKASSARCLQVCTCSYPLQMTNTILIPAQGPPAFLGTYYIFRALAIHSVDFIRCQKPQNCARYRCTKQILSTY